MTSYVVRVAVCGVVSKSKLRLTKGRQPSDVLLLRIIAFKEEHLVMYTYNSKVLSMGRQKALIKMRREAKRVLRRDSRSHKQREEESVVTGTDGRSRSHWHGARWSRYLSC